MGGRTIGAEHRLAVVRHTLDVQANLHVEHEHIVLRGPCPMLEELNGMEGKGRRVGFSAGGNKIPVLPIQHTCIARQHDRRSRGN